MKTFVLLLCTVLAGPVWAGAVETKDQCCATIAGGGFTPTSLYQADAQFTADTGKSFTLGELRGRPVVIDMFFASCGFACPLTVGELQAMRARLPQSLREQAVFVLVSFDVERDTPAALTRYRAERGLDASWILLHGNDDAVRELAALLGVRYKREADGAFSHSNVVTLLNREGEVAHQWTGLKTGLDNAATLISAASAEPQAKPATP